MLILSKQELLDHELKTNTKQEKKTPNQKTPQKNPKSKEEQAERKTYNWELQKFPKQDLNLPFALFSSM